MNNLLNIEIIIRDLNIFSIKLLFCKNKNKILVYKFCLCINHKNSCLQQYLNI